MSNYKKNYPDVFHYAASEEKYFERRVSDFGYVRKTTFFSDLSIAEWYGSEDVKDTYNRVVEFWKEDLVYFTEFVMSLNLKSWEWDARQNKTLSKLYSELYYKAKDVLCDTFKDDKKACQYIFDTLD